jgi:hypothetical protein
MTRAILKAVARKLGFLYQVINKESEDVKLLALGRLLANQQQLLKSDNFNDYEFKIFSEWGDDGLIQCLIKKIAIPNQTFIEFGVEDYMESNTRFLLMNNYWSGFVMDGSERNMRSLRSRSWFFKYDLRCKAAWIDRDNVNSLIAESGWTDIGILHIDLDGNDYFILKELDFSSIKPAILILEYNSLFGPEREISVPYDPTFYRSRVHYSNLFCGASLGALTLEANHKGYSLIGCNNAGNNAYYVRNELLGSQSTCTVQNAFKLNKFRQGRKPDGQFSFLTRDQEIELIRGMEVLNVRTGQIEKF